MPDQPTYPFLPEDACLSEQQLFDYIDGKMPALEMNAVEKHLLHCPFCSDALEGFRKIKSREKVTGAVPVLNTPEKEEKKESKVIPLHPNRKWYSLVAALVLIIGIVSVLRLSLSDKAENAKMAENKQAADSFSPAHSITPGKNLVSADSLPAAKPALEEQKEESGAVLKTETSTLPGIQGPAAGAFSSHSVQEQDVDQAKPDASYAWTVTGDTTVTMEREIAQDVRKDQADKQLFEKNSAPVSTTDDKAEIARAENLSYTTAPPPVSVNKKKYKSPKTTSGKANSVANTDEENIPVMSGTAAPAPEQAQTQSDSTSVPRMYPLKASDKDLDQSYESGVKLFDAGKYEACLPFFDEVLKNPKHRYYEDAQWKKSQALIKLNRKDEAKTLLLEIEKKGGKYKQQATEALKNY